MNQGLMKKRKKNTTKAHAQKCSHQRPGLHRMRNKRIEPSTSATSRTSPTSLAQSFIHDPQPCTDCWYCRESECQYMLTGSSRISAAIKRIGIKISPCRKRFSVSLS